MKEIPNETFQTYYSCLSSLDPARSDHQGEQVASSGLAAEASARVLLHQANGQVWRQFARGRTDYGARSLSLHLQAQIDSCRAVEQRAVHHDVVSAIRAAPS